MNQGPSGGMSRSDSETNGQTRVGSGSSTSDKPVRRTTSESAGLLDATEEFIANLKRKTTVSSNASASTNSSDAMDVLNQLLFAHTSSLSSTATKSFSGDDSPPSASSHQTKETEFRQDMGGMNPPVIVSDDSRSPSEPPNNDDHQRSNSKGKDNRVLDDHPPRPPPPRRIDPGDDVFDRPPSDMHGTKRSSDHSSRRRDDSRYDRYDRDRRDYYDRYDERYDDRYDTRYDERYDRDRYHEQYGGHPSPPKRLPLPPPPPPRPRY